MGPCTTAAHWSDRNIDGLKFAIRPTADETMCLELGGVAAFLRLGCGTPSTNQLWYDAAKVPDARLPVSTSFNQAVANFCRLVKCSKVSALNARRYAALFERTKSSLSGGQDSVVLRDASLVLAAWDTAYVSEYIAQVKIFAVADRIDRDLNAQFCGSSCVPKRSPVVNALAQAVNFQVESNAIVARDYSYGQTDLALSQFPGSNFESSPRPIFASADSHFKGIARWAVERQWAVSSGQISRAQQWNGYMAPIESVAGRLGLDGRWWWTYVPGLNILRTMSECQSLGEQASTRTLTNGIRCGVNGFLAGATTGSAVNSTLDLLQSFNAVESGLSNLGRLTEAEVAANEAQLGVSFNCSFAGEVKVLMGNSLAKPISEIVVGDEVISQDPETRDVSVRRVTRLWEHVDQVFSVQIGDGTIETTSNHPFWDETDRKWIVASDLRKGMALLMANGEITTVLSVSPFKHRAQAFNLSVEGIHTYHVMAGSKAVLVHNACSAALGRNLGPAPVEGMEAHHLVPGGGILGQEARDALVRVGIGIDSAENGVWLSYGSHVATFTNGYRNYVVTLITQAELLGGKQGVLTALNDLRFELAATNDFGRLNRLPR